ENGLTLEVAALLDAVVVPNHGGVFGADYCVDLLTGPNVELALVAFTVGVFSTVEAAGGILHVPPYIVEDLLNDAAVELRSRDLEGVQINSGQQRVVVQHLLEMGDEPPVVGRIAVKTAAQ